MEKLELKHIVGYLPYGLKMQHKTELAKHGKEKGLRPWQKQLTYLFSATDCEKYEWLPIIRPLSYLTKEIEVNGEKFVPMHKLLEYSETNYFSEDDNIKIKFNTQILSCDWNTYKYSKEQDAIIKYVERTSDGDLIYSLTYSSLLRRFVFRDETHKRPLGVGYQIDLFQKLYEWHFDIHGLIEKGLAIDINTLDNGIQ